MLWFSDMSTVVGHFVSSPREREKRDRRDSRVDEREGQGRKKYRNESEETEEIKYSLTGYNDCSPGEDTQHLRHTQPPPLFISHS